MAGEIARFSKTFEERVWWPALRSAWTTDKVQSKSKHNIDQRRHALRKYELGITYYYNHLDCTLTTTRHSLNNGTLILTSQDPP